MTRNQMIDKILALRGVPQGEWSAKREIFAPYGDDQIASALAGEEAAVEEAQIRASRKSRRSLLSPQSKAAGQRQSRKRAGEAWAAGERARAQMQAREAAGTTSSQTGAAPKKARKSRQSVPKGLQKRASRISRAIKAGRISAKRGVTKPSEAAGKNPKARAEKFVAMYKGARVSRVSLKESFKGIAGKKYPYYVVHGYRVPGYPVGGGARGPGVIRPIPGSGAKPFMQLPEGKKHEVVAFLNSEKGKALRSKGAPKDVNLTAVVAAHLQTREKASRRSRPAQQRASRKTMRQAGR